MMKRKAINNNNNHTNNKKKRKNKMTNILKIKNKNLRFSFNKYFSNMICFSVEISGIV
jgi:hypothetical protein